MLSVLVALPQGVQAMNEGRDLGGTWVREDDGETAGFQQSHRFNTQDPAESKKQLRKVKNYLFTSSPPPTESMHTTCSCEPN